MLLEHVQAYVGALSRVEKAQADALDLLPAVAQTCAELADTAEFELKEKQKTHILSRVEELYWTWQDAGRLFDFGVRLLDAVNKTSLCTSDEAVAVVRHMVVLRVQRHWHPPLHRPWLPPLPKALSAGKLKVLRLQCDLVDYPAIVKGMPRAILAATDYSQALGLTGNGTVGAAGRILLSLPTRNAVMWLLALEMTHSAGDFDEMRTSKSVFKQILDKREAYFIEESRFEHGPQFCWDTIERLEDFGLCKIEHIPIPSTSVEEYGYELNAMGNAMLTELLDTPNSPMLSLAEAMLANDSAIALSAAGSAGAATANRSLEGELVRHIRTMGHELRNKLVPADMSLGVLETELSPEAKRANTALQLARRSVQDALGFVDNMAALSSGLLGPQDWLELGACLRDATKFGRNGNTQARVLLDDSTNDWDVLGGREELMLIASNLVRNALQAKTDAQVEVAVTADSTSGLVLTIDDNGPGIPEADRGRVFDSGFTTKLGGSGQGLALVRQAVERSFEGRIVCETRPLGGARFIIYLPNHRIRPRTGSQR